MSVLDVGCGTGITTEFMRKMGADVVGLDISDQLLKKGKELYPYTKFLCADFCEIDLKEKFDLVCLVDVLEHVPWEKRIKFMDNVCSHARKIYLNIPDGRYLSYLRENKPSVLQIIDEPYSIREIIELVSRFGFEAISVNYYDYQYQEYVFIPYHTLQGVYAKLTEAI